MRTHRRVAKIDHMACDSAELADYEEKVRDDVGHLEMCAYLMRRMSLQCVWYISDEVF